MGPQGAEKHETGPSPLGAGNSPESLENLPKKIKNPSETQSFLYAVAVATGGKNDFIKPITICGEFDSLTVMWGEKRPLSGPWRWQLCTMAWLTF